MIRTRVGYAGGDKEDPTYRNLGNHSETIQIDYDPDMISYEDLLAVFWETNEAVVVPFTRQYYSIVFYHNEEQKQAAERSYEQRKEAEPGTVTTEITPYSGFTRAEDYHQKYYLQSVNALMQGISGAFGSFTDFVDSTAVARLNGYVGGNGDKEILARDLDRYGLTPEGKMKLLEVATKGLNPVCGIPGLVPE